MKTLYKKSKVMYNLMVAGELCSTCTSKVTNEKCRVIDLCGKCKKLYFDTCHAKYRKAREAKEDKVYAIRLANAATARKARMEALKLGSVTKAHKRVYLTRNTDIVGALKAKRDTLKKEIISARKGLKKTEAALKQLRKIKAVL